MRRLGTTLNAAVRFHWLSAGAAFFLAAIVQTWPIVRHPADRLADVPAQPGDAGSLLWSLWWFKHATVDLQVNPYHTDVLYFPQGADLYLHALTPVNGLLSVPLQVLTGEVILSWNLLAIFLFFLSGLSMYALAYHVTREPLPSLLAGFLFAFSPRILMHFQSGEWNISTVWPIPLFMLFVLRLRERGGWADAAAAGLVWSVITYNWIEYGVDAGVFLGLFLAYWSALALRDRDRKGFLLLCRGGAVTLAIWFVLSAPVLIPTFDAVHDNPNLPGGDEFWSADLLAFVTPSPLWGPGTDPNPSGYPHNSIGSIEGTSYLGFTALVLAVISLLTIKRRPARVLFWLMIFLLFAMLSLGPYLYVDNDKTISVLGVSFSLPLPYQLYEQLPLVSARRITSRIVVFGLPALAVLSAIGFAFLTSWLRRSRAYLAPALTALVFALVVGEYWSPPIHVSPLVAAPVFTEIKDAPADSSVLHVPIGRADGHTAAGDGNAAWLNNYYQTVHEKAVFGGYLSRASSQDFDWIVRQPGIRYLSCPNCSAEPLPEDLDVDAVRQLFRDYRIRYVVVHNLTPHAWQLPIYGDTLTLWDKYLKDVCGFTQIYADRELSVYSASD